MTYWPITGGDPTPLWKYGDGSDGAVTESGGGTVTLTSDMFYSSLTVTNNTTIATAGFRIFCTGAVQIDSGSSIQVDGDDGGAGKIAGTGAGTNGSVGFGYDGGAGGSGGVGGTGSSAADSLGGNGGAGGDGDTYAGGAAGTATEPAANDGSIRHALLAQVAHAIHASAPVVTLIKAGAGGAGGGAGNNKGDGGGGGGAAGVLVLCALSIDNSGTISANGGDGAAGTDFGGGDEGGGGGGAGGGVVITIATSRTGNTPTATKGSGGAAAGASSTAGSNGLDGNVIEL